VSYLESVQDDRVLELLEPKGLKGSSLPEGCMDGTREDILKTVDDWIADLDAPQNILWLQGHPGVGKSTVASSVVDRLRARKRLGSYFFFQREKVTAQTIMALGRLRSLAAISCGQELPHQKTNG
jgi:hypothetical protein